MESANPNLTDSFEEIDCENRRRYFRVEPIAANRPVVSWQPTKSNLEKQKDRPWFESLLWDITGCSIGLLVPASISDNLSVGMGVHVFIFPRKAKKPILVSCLIRRIDSKSEGQGYRCIGLEIDLSSTDSQATERQIASLAATCERENARNLSRNHMGTAGLDFRKPEAHRLLRGTYHSRTPSGCCRGTRAP